MNITKYLCKKFDIEKKGYVTIEDIVSSIIEYTPYIIVGIFFFMLIILISVTIGHIYNCVIHNESIDGLRDSLIGFFILTITSIICFMLYKLYKIISPFKIIKCSMK